MSVLELERVSYAYPGAREPALRDVTLRIDPGEFVVLAGGSAAGKSTLLRAAAGIVPHVHGGTFAGEARCGGLSTRDHGPASLSATAGSLFQDPETQIVMGSVRAEIAFPLEGRGDGAGAVARGVEEVALALGIAHLLDRRTGDLSGGELPRVALAAALARRPPLLLLDEPTSQLDPVSGDELIWLLRRLNEEWGTAVVLAEHRLERCLAAADRVVALRDGAVACDAAPHGFQDWAVDHAPELATPAATLFAEAGLRPLPTGVKDARRSLAALGLLPEAEAQPDRPAPPGPSGAAPGATRRCGSTACGTSCAAAPCCCAGSTSPSSRGSVSRSWAATARASRRSCATPRASWRRRGRAGRSRRGSGAAARRDRRRGPYPASAP